MTETLHYKNVKTPDFGQMWREDKTNLHDEKMRVVDIKTNGAEQVLNPGVFGVDPIDEVFVPATNYNLTEREDLSISNQTLDQLPALYSVFLILTCLVTVISSCVSNPRGLWLLLELSNVMDTVALVIPPCPFLYTKSWRLEART